MGAVDRPIIWVHSGSVGGHARCPPRLSRSAVSSRCQPVWPFALAAAAYSQAAGARQE